MVSLHGWGPSKQLDGSKAKRQREREREITLQDEKKPNKYMSLSFPLILRCHDLGSSSDSIRSHDFGSSSDTHTIRSHGPRKLIESSDLMTLDAFRQTQIRSHGVFGSSWTLDPISWPFLALDPFDTIRSHGLWKPFDTIRSHGL